MARPCWTPPPLSQRTRAVKNVVIADAQMLVRTEIQSTGLHIIERRDLIALRVDASAQIDRRIVFALLADRIPDVQTAVAVRAIGNKIQNAMVTLRQQTGLHGGKAFHIDGGWQFGRFLPPFFIAMCFPQMAPELAVAHTVAARKDQPVALFVETEIAIEKFSRVDKGRQGRHASVLHVAQESGFIDIAIPAGFKEMVIVLPHIRPHGSEEKYGIGIESSGIF